MRGQLVHDARQDLGQLLGKLFFGEARALSERLDDIRAKGRAELARRYGLILTGTNPGIGRTTGASLLQLIQETTQSSEQAT